MTAPAPVGARSVYWWGVHTFVVPVLNRISEWPLIGTPEWCELPDDDPRKIASVFDAARHYALYLETRQQAQSDASKAIAAATDWSKVAREMRNLQDFRQTHPWTQRRSA